MAGRQGAFVAGLVAVLAAVLAIGGCSDEAVREHQQRRRAPGAPAAPAPQASASPASAPEAPAPPTPPAVPAPQHSGKPPSSGALRVPVAGVDASMLRDTYDERRGGNRPHEALDILAPRGTPVVAVAPGRVVKLFTSEPGGLTVYQFDPTERYAYYYAHLDRYAEGLHEGQWLDAGDAIGTVGFTGNASPDAPHLHFALFQLGPERQWWKGTPVNPYPLFLGGPR